MRRGDAERLRAIVARGIDEMIEEGYHYPNEGLIALAEVERDLGGRDRLEEWDDEKG